MMQNVSQQDPMGTEYGRSARQLQLTLGDLLLVGVLLIGAVGRFANLGAPLMTPAEAEAAWTVWAFWQPSSEILATGSPLYNSLTKLLTPVLGFTDGSMRLVPALFGLATLFLPWLWRHRLGNIGALTTSFLLAVSPLNLMVSRTAGGDSTAVFAILLLLISGIQFIDSRRSTWLWAAATAVGIGLTSSPLFFTGVLTLAVALLIRRWIGLPLFLNEERPVANAETWRTAGLVAGGVFLGITTMLLWLPAGLGTAVRIPADWLGQFNLTAPAEIVNPLLALARYELILLLVGLVALIWATWQSQPLAAFFTYWLATGLLMLLFQQGEMSLALLLTLPGALLIGQLAQTALNGRWQLTSWLVTIGGLLVMMLLLLNSSRLLRVAAGGAEQLEYLLVIVLGLALGLTGVYFILSYDVPAVRQGSLLAVILFLAYYQWGVGWWLTQEANNDPRERWVQEGTHDGVRVMLPILSQLSEQVANAEANLDIVSLVDTPVLRWYLRTYDQLEFIDTLPVGAQHTVIISPFEADLPLGSEYLGADYGLLRFEPAPPGQSATLITDTIRWWLFQESPAVMPEQRLIVWVRADAVQEGP